MKQESIGWPYIPYFGLESQQKLKEESRYRMRGRIIFNFPGGVFPDTPLRFHKSPEHFYNKLTFCHCKFKFNCCHLQPEESFLPLLSLKQIKSKTPKQMEEVECQLDFS